jgi:hypothetical protein
MSIEQIAYGTVVWFTLIAVLFMGMILYIGRVEINNSKRKLNLKLVMHYIHRFQRMKAVFDSQRLFKENIDCKDLVEKYKKNNRFLHEKLFILSEMIGQNCVQNQFIFIKNKKLKSDLILQAKDLTEKYQAFRSELHIFEEDLFESEETKRFENLQHQYGLMLHILDDMLHKLNNEVLIDVIEK